MHIQTHQLVVLFLLWIVMPSLEAITLYRSSDLVMQTLNAESGARNDHPADGVDPESLARLFASLQLVDGEDGTSVYLLSEKDARKLGAELAMALGRVTADQEIHLALFREVESSRRHATGIRLFAQEGRLHLIFGQVDVFLNEFREPYAKLPRAGSRLEATRQPARIAEQVWLRVENGRRDWVSYPLVSASGERPGLRIPDALPTADPTYPAAAPTQSEAPTPDAEVPRGSDRWHELESGLEALERLRAKGLISQQEYDRSRARLMREAGL